MYLDNLTNMVGSLPLYPLCPAPMQNYSQLSAFLERQEELRRELQGVRSSCQAIRAELEGLRKAQEEQQAVHERKKKDRPYPKKRKIFKKDYFCPIDHCERKYSSRIALRAHIRQKHERAASLE